MAVHTYDELKQYQALPLEAKIMLTEDRIRAFVNEYGIDGVYLSYSGGKDSSVLFHILRRMYGNEIPAVFADTGLEYPEIRSLVKKQKEQGLNIEMVRPKISFPQVLEKYGYPVVSKEESRKIYDYRHSNSEKLKAIRIGGGIGGIREKWRYLIDAPFEISSYCCDKIKKQPLHTYEVKHKRKPFIATMAEESRLRLRSWMKYGCNVFENKKIQSRPLMFWSEQDILEYIRKYDVEIATIYGEIQEDLIGRLKCTGVHRTGCMFCMFGVHLEGHPNRFEKMKITHPKQYNYCINELGLGKVLDYIGVKY